MLHLVGILFPHTGRSVTEPEGTKHSKFDSRTDGEKWEPEQTVCDPYLRISVPVGSEQGLYYFRDCDQPRSLQCWCTTHSLPAGSHFNDLVTSKMEVVRFPATSELTSDHRRSNIPAEANLNK